MNTLTIIGTITIDRLHLSDQIRTSFGGIPWFAVELATICDLNISIVTTVGKNFPIVEIPKSIREISKIKISGENTTTIDIFPEKRGVPANVRNFTGEIKTPDVTGKIAIVSPLFQEVSIQSIKKLRSIFTTIIIDIQGFTRPNFKQHIRLSDDSKIEPSQLSQLCKLADIIKFSENEFKVILPRLSLINKLNTLHSWGLNNIVITKSHKGCLISSINSVPKTLSVKSGSPSVIIGSGDKFVILLGIFLTKNNSFEDSVIKTQFMLQTLMAKHI